MLKTECLLCPGERVNRIERVFKAGCLLFPGKRFNRIERESCVENRIFIVSRKEF